MERIKRLDGKGCTNCYCRQMIAGEDVCVGSAKPLMSKGEYVRILYRRVYDCNEKPEWCHLDK